MSFDISWEDSYWERQRERYDDGDSWSIQIFDANEEEDEFDWLDELEEDEE